MPALVSGSDCVDLGTVGHGGRGAGPGDGDAGDNAGKLCGFREIHAFGQGGGEAAVEGVAGAGGFDDGAGVDGGDVAGEGAVFDEGSLGTEGEDDVADAAGEEGDAACSAEARSVTGIPVRAVASVSLGVR